MLWKSKKSDQFKWLKHRYKIVYKYEKNIFFVPVIANSKGSYKLEDIYNYKF